MRTGRHRDKFLNAAAILSIEDVARTVAFYEQELGLELEHEMWGDPPEHASLTVGATTVHFASCSPTTGIEGSRSSQNPRTSRGAGGSS
jgi:catechol 2,3-dioxygenase-like lactoylglutathione lyase family enzyme